MGGCRETDRFARLVTVLERPQKPVKQPVALLLPTLPAAESQGGVAAADRSAPARRGARLPEAWYSSVGQGLTSYRLHLLTAPEATGGQRPVRDSRHRRSYVPSSCVLATAGADAVSGFLLVQGLGNPATGRCFA